MKKICTVLMVLLLVFTAAHAQFENNVKTKWAVGMWGGPTILFSDYHNSGETVNGWNMGFLGQKAINHAISLRFDVGYAQYKDIEDLIRRGSPDNPGLIDFSPYNTAYQYKPFVLNYKTYVYYGDFILQGNIPIHSLLGKEKTKFNMYGFGGVGLLLSQTRGNRNNNGIPNYNSTFEKIMGASDIALISRDASKAIFDDTWADYLLGGPQDPTTGDSFFKQWKKNMELILGLGVNYNLSEKFEIFGETRFAMGYNEDNLDGVFADGNAAKINGNDIMFEGRVGVKYRWNSKDKEAIDWFDNKNASHYKQTQQLADQMDGMYSDTDGDGVPDYLDKDPETPAGAAVDGSGRAMDSDYDGVPDYADNDLFTPKGITVDEEGNPLDSDNDGVADGLDLEPDTPEGSLVNFQGIAIGSQAEDAGMPWIIFERNSSQLSEARHAGSLSYIVSLMRSNPEITILIEGHADRTGTEQYNMDLGWKRAEAVKRVLVKAGIDQNRIKTDSKGEAVHVAEGNDKFSDTMNRRAEIKIIR